MTLRALDHVLDWGRRVCLHALMFAVCTATATCGPSQQRSPALPTSTQTIASAQPPLTRRPPPEPVPSEARWTAFSDTKYVTDMAFDRQGNLWAASLHGVLRWRLEDGLRVEHAEDVGLPSKGVECVAVGGDGSLWFGTRNAGVAHVDPSTMLDQGRAKSSRRDGERWVTYTVDDGLADNRVQDVAVGYNGTLWFATYGGVSRFDPSESPRRGDDGWTTYTIDDGLADNRVLAVAAHPDGSIWFGTFGAGVSRFDPSTGSARSGEAWTTYTRHNGLADDRVRAIAVAPDGTLWFATYGGGVSHFHPPTSPGLGSGQWTTYMTDDGLAENVLSCVTVASDGTVWIGAADNGVSRFDGASFTRYTVAHGLLDNEIWSIVAAPDGSIWASSINGISRLPG